MASAKLVQSTGKSKKGGIFFDGVELINSIIMIISMKGAESTNQLHRNCEVF